MITSLGLSQSTRIVPAHADGAGSRQACSGIRLLLLLLILRGALADVTPVQDNAACGERVPAQIITLELAEHTLHQAR